MRQRIKTEWQMAGPLGRASMVAAPVLLALLLLSLAWTAGRAAPPARPRSVALPSATATPRPVEPWIAATGDGRGAQASEVIRLSAACVTQRLSYNARLSELGRQGVWIGFAVIDDGGDAVEMTPSRDVLAYPKGDFDFSLPPGDYRLRVQGRGAEWAYTLECLPGD